MLVTYYIVRFLVTLFYIGEVIILTSHSCKILDRVTVHNKNGGLVCEPVQNAFASTQWKTSVTKCGPNCQTFSVSNKCKIITQNKVNDKFGYTG